MRKNWQLTTEQEHNTNVMADRLEIKSEIGELIESIDNFIKENKDQVKFVQTILNKESANGSKDIESILAKLNQSVFVDYENNLSYANKAKFVITCVYGLSQNSNKYLSNFLELSKNSWLLDSFWVEAAIRLSRFNQSFKEFLIDTSYSKLCEYSFNITNKGYFEDISLSNIWFNYFTHETNSEFWKWVELLIELDKNKFLHFFNDLKDPVVVNDILSAPVFYDNFELWAELIIKAPIAFESNSKWNGSLIIPCLLVQALSYITQFTRKTHEDDKDEILSTATTDLLINFVEVVAKRDDFVSIFKRWGTFITRNFILNNRDTTKFSYFKPQELLSIMLEAIEDKEYLLDVPTDIELWEPWVYRCMLSLLASKNKSLNLSCLPAEPFIEEWNFGYSEKDKWFGRFGLALFERSQLFKENEPNKYPVQLLATSLCEASPNRVVENWQLMWNASFSVRQALEFYLEPPEELSKLEVYTAADLSCLLLDLGLSMIDFLTSSSRKLTGELLSDISTLFRALWSASFELLSLSIFSEDFIQKIQWHLVLRRALWIKRSQSGEHKEFYSKVNSSVGLKHEELLQELFYDPPALITLLPLYEQNSLERDFVKTELKKAGFLIEELKKIASEYKDASSRKFKITQRHLDLIDNLKMIKIVPLQ